MIIGHQPGDSRPYDKHTDNRPLDGAFAMFLQPFEAGLRRFHQFVLLERVTCLCIHYIPSKPESEEDSRRAPGKPSAS